MILETIEGPQYGSGSVKTLTADVMEAARKLDVSNC